MSNKNEDIYAQALEEFEGDNRNQGLYAKCFAEADGDENKAKARYIKSRVDELSPADTHEKSSNIDEGQCRLTKSGPNYLLGFKYLLRKIHNFINDNKFVSFYFSWVIFTLILMGVSIILLFLYCAAMDRVIFEFWDAHIVKISILSLVCANIYVYLKTFVQNKKMDQVVGFSILGPLPEFLKSTAPPIKAS